MSSIIKVDQIQLADGSTPTAGDLGLNTTGSVLQVVSSYYTTATSVTSSTFTDIGLSVSITPTSTSNKILVLTSVAQSTSAGDTVIRMVRDSTVIGEGTTGTVFNGIAGQSSGSYANASVSSSANYLDSPSTTSSVTYKIQAATNSQGYINRRAANLEFGQASYITVMEIAG